MVTFSFDGPDIVMDLDGASQTVAGYEGFVHLRMRENGSNADYFIDDFSVLGLILPPPIPTITSWGLVLLILVILASGTLLLRRRRSGSSGPLPG